MEEVDGQGEIGNEFGSGDEEQNWDDAAVGDIVSPCISSASS